MQRYADKLEHAKQVAERVATTEKKLVDMDKFKGKWVKYAKERVAEVNKNAGKS